MRDGTLSLPLDAGDPAIKCSDKLSQVMDEGQV